jgi:hypothetical protein
MRSWNIFGTQTHHGQIRILRLTTAQILLDENMFFQADNGMEIQMKNIGSALRFFEMPPQTSKGENKAL